MVAPEVAPMSYPNNRPPNAGNTKLEEEPKSREILIHKLQYIAVCKYLKLLLSLVSFSTTRHSLLSFKKHSTCFSTKTKQEMLTPFWSNSGPPLHWLTRHSLLPFKKHSPFFSTKSKARNVTPIEVKFRSSITLAHKIYPHQRIVVQKRTPIYSKHEKNS